MFSLVKMLLLLVAMLFAIVHGQDICQLEPNEIPHHILSIGSLDPNQLVLLTSEYIYELGQTDLNGTMNLPSPVPLKDKWLSLAANPLFRRHKKSDILNSIVIHEPNQNDSQKAIFLLLNESLPTGNVSTIVYSVESGLVSTITWTYDLDSGLEGIEGHASVWMASKENYFYVLLPDRYGGYVMALVRVHSNQSAFELVGKLVRLCMYGDGTAEDEQQEDKVYGVFLASTVFKCKRSWDRPILGGVHRNGRFYLFGQDKVYGFSEQVKNELTKPFPLTMLSYDEFVLCPNRTRTTRKSKFGLLTFEETEKAVEGTTAKEDKSSLVYVFLFFLGMSFIVLLVYLVQCMMHEPGHNQTNEQTEPRGLVMTAQQTSQPIGGAIIRVRSPSVSPIRQVGRSIRRQPAHPISPGHVRGLRAAPYEERQSDESSFQFLVTKFA